MNKTTKAFSTLVDSFKNLFSAVKEDLDTSPKTVVEAKPINEKELYADKLFNILQKVCALTEKEKNQFPNLIDHRGNSGFQTTEFSIINGRDLDYNSNFSKHDIILQDTDGKVVFKQSKIYDIHCHDTEVEYEIKPNYKEVIDTLVDKFYSNKSISIY